MERTPDATRKPYSTPRLLEYGSIAKLTQGNTSAGFDAPIGSPISKRNCL